MCWCTETPLTPSQKGNMYRFNGEACPSSSGLPKLITVAVIVTWFPCLSASLTVLPTYGMAFWIKCIYLYIYVYIYNIYIIDDYYFDMVDIFPDDKYIRIYLACTICDIIMSKLKTILGKNIQLWGKIVREYASFTFCNVRNTIQKSAYRIIAVRFQTFKFQ